MQPPVPSGRSGAAPLGEADQAALNEAKRMLRRAVTARRAARTEEARAADDHARFELVRGLLGEVAELVVATYLSVDAEPGTLELISYLYASGAQVLLPVLGPRADGTRRREPDWAYYAGADALRLGFRNIGEPTGPALGPKALRMSDVIVCSALAATPAGDRLGVGGGWFDRALAYASPEAVTVALVNDDEVLPTLPVHDWDRRVDVLATPTRLIQTDPSHSLHQNS